MAHLTIITLVLLPLSLDTREDCRRDRSRIVRKIINQELLPILKEYNLDLAPECPLTSARDIYSDQESEGKRTDSGSKWVCQYCGKAFYEEQWLDRHFDNRHPDRLKQGPWLTCLADYCDIFRCDVIQGHKKVEYWDVALCRDQDLQRVRNKCQDLISSCILQSGPEKSQPLLDKLNLALCSYLNCDNYWELPPSEVSPIGTATYTIAIILLMFGLMLYYLMVYAHFYTEDPLFDLDQRSNKEDFAHYVAPTYQEIRLRTRPVLELPR